MKNIDLYYRINIFLDLYYERTKLDDLGGFLGGADILIFEKRQLNKPIGVLTRMVDIFIWDDWLRILGLEKKIPGDEEWESYSLGEFPKFDIDLYIKTTGEIEIDENLQFDYMYKFLKLEEKEFKYEWSKLFNDIDNDIQTKQEWEKSFDILNSLLVGIKN